MLGFSAFSETGIASLPGDTIVLTGLFATTVSGMLNVSGKAIASLEGVFATATLNSAMVAANVNIYLSNVTTTGFIGSLLVWDPTPPPPSGSWGPVAPGSGGGWTPVAPSLGGGWVPVTK